jgi:uncharacterized protein (TIGR02246 family)
MKRALTVTAVLVLAALPWSSAYADQAADREAIHALMWHYARALDTLDALAYAALYTQDGEFSAGGTAVKGRDGLRKMIEDLKAGRAEREAKGTPSPAMYHMTTDAWTEFVDDTHARHHTYWITVFGPAERGGSPNVAAAGRGVDDLVKVNGEWKIQRRDVAPPDER